MLRERAQVVDGEADGRVVVAVRLLPSLPVRKVGSVVSFLSALKHVSVVTRKMLPATHTRNVRHCRTRTRTQKREARRPDTKKSSPRSLNLATTHCGPRIVQNLN